MQNLTDAINPQALKAARKRRGMSQQQLADAVHAIAKGCTKDTVSRWERGKTLSVRSYLRKPLCDVLRVKWEKLTEPTDQPEDIAGDAKSKVSIGKSVRTSLQLVAERYDVRPRDVLELAPLLFLIVAERSLLERKQRLQVIYAALQEADEKLLNNCAHLGGIVVARSVSAEDQLQEEEESLSKRDVFGRTIKYEDWAEGDEGPFVHFVRELAKDLAKDAVTSIDSFDGDMIESYQIAGDTLRECTGISEDEEQGQSLLRYIRCGVIDFAECLRIKRSGDEADYRQWLSDELARAEEESHRLLEEFMGDIGFHTVANAELTSSDKRS